MVATCQQSEVMSTRIATPFFGGLAWAIVSSTFLFATGVCAQTAQAQKGAPASVKEDTKREPAAPTSADSSQTPRSSQASGAADSTQTQTKSAEGTPAASASGSGTAPAAESPTSAPSQAAADASGTSVSTGSGLFEQSQSAAAAESTNPSSGEQARPGFELGGYVRGDMFAGKVPDANQGAMKAGYGELALKFRVQKEKYGDAYAEVRLRDGLQGETQSTILDVREAYVNGYFGPLDLRLGKQIIVWGRADALNPTNNLTPNDLRVRSPIEDDRRVGNIGARAFLNFQPFRLEGVWMPLYVASELPAYKLPDAVYFGDTRYPAPNLDKGLGAGRIHLELSAIEMSASFVHGYAPLPGLTAQSYTYGVSPTVILISRTAYEQNVVGFDFSTAIGDYLGLRGEAAYRRPLGYQNKIYAPRPDLQYVLGVDHTFGSVSVIAQYLGRYIFDWHKENGPDSTWAVSASDLAGWDTLSPTLRQQVEDTINSTLAQKNQILFGQTERIQHLVSGRIEWLTLDETLSLSALGVVNFSTKEWAAFPKISYKISDRLSTAIGGEIYRGPDNTLFGMVKDVLTAGYTELRYTF